VDWEGHGDFVDIQSAIDAGKTRLFVRAGTYSVDTTITIKESNTLIFGEERISTVIRFSEIATAGINLIESAYSFSIKNITLACDTIAGTHFLNGIYFSEANNGYESVIENCYFQYFEYGSGICLGTGGQISNFLITNNEFIGNLYHITGQRLEYIKIIDNIFNDSVADITTGDISLNYVAKSFIDRNKFLGSEADFGIRLYLSVPGVVQQNMISNNYFYIRTSNFIIHNYDTVQGEDTDCLIYRNTISNNVMLRCGLEAIYMNRCEYNIISSNLIWEASHADSNYSNIYLLWCNYNNISDNKIEAPVGYANIQVVGHGNVVVGNYLPGSTVAGNALEILNPDNEFGHNIETGLIL
jgi:hypothetical protein